MCSTGCGAGWASTRCCTGCWPGGAVELRVSSGCCSRWSPTGRWRRPRSWPPPTGSPTTCTSTACPTPSDDACYRAMDWLHRRPRTRWSARCSTQVADLLNLEVDLLFFDTTSTYFETEDPDEPVGPRRARPRRPRPPPPPTTATATARTTARTPAGATAGRVPDLRQVQGLPRRPAPGRDRDGRHPRRDPGAGVVLAGQHHRLRADPPGQATRCGTGPCRDRVGRRPRVLLRRRTAATCAAAAGTTSRREAALRLAGGQGRPVPPGPLPARRRQPAGQGSQDRPTPSGS